MPIFRLDGTCMFVCNHLIIFCPCINVYKTTFIISLFEALLAELHVFAH
jgi:hypothetical protein